MICLGVCHRRDDLRLKSCGFIFLLFKYSFCLSRTFAWRPVSVHHHVKVQMLHWRDVCGVTHSPTVSLFALSSRMLCLWAGASFHNGNSVISWWDFPAPSILPASPYILAHEQTDGLRVPALCQHLSRGATSPRAQLWFNSTARRVLRVWACGTASACWRPDLKSGNTSRL